MSVLSFQGAVIGRGRLAVAAVGLPVIQEGFVIELQSGFAAYYFGESMGILHALPAGRTLHAVSTGPRNSITVTAFTEIICQRALALAGRGALTPP